MALSTISGGSLETAEEVPTKFQHRARIPRQLLLASLVCLLAFILFLISFASPYWLSSYKYTYSSFVRLGLWDFCFRDFRHPQFQYDDKFNGCHWGYSDTYHNVRDWLQPGWFMFVQAMMVFSLLFSMGALAVLAFVFMLYFIRVRFIAIAAAFALEALAALPMLLALIVFRAMCYSRSWLLNPQFNHLDWSYFVAIASLLAHIAGSGLLFLALLRSLEERRKLNNLVYNMQPRF